MKALGLIETKGFTAAVVAADTALKTASVSLVTTPQTIGDGCYTVILTGDVASLQAAVEAAAQAAGTVGQVVAAHVIARPHDDLAAIINESPAPTPEKAPVVKTASRAKTPGI